MNAVMQPGQVHIRPMRELDLDAVVAIESGAYPFPWTRGIFADCLRVGYSCWVMTVDDAVIGYGIVAVGAGEAHILNLCIDQEHQGCGYGRRLLDRLIDLARWHRANAVFLEVRPSNFGAVRIYRRAGFQIVGRRPNYYPKSGPGAGERAERREDALIMAFSLRAE